MQIGFIIKLKLYLIHKFKKKTEIDEDWLTLLR